MSNEFSKKNIQDIVKRIVKENIQNPNSVENVSDEKFMESIDINSIASIKIIVAIEDEFGIEFDNNLLDVELFQSLDGLVSYVQNKIRQRQGEISF